MANYGPDNPYQGFGKSLVDASGNMNWKGSLISKGISTVGSFIKEPPGYSGTYGSLQKGMDSAYDAIADGIAMVPGWGTAASLIMKGAGVLNKGLQRVGGGTDGMTKTDAILNSNFLGLTPLGMINGFGGKKAKEYKRDNELDAASGAGFGGFQSLQNTTMIGAGKKYGAFSQGARRKQDALTEYTQGVKHTISGIVDFNTLNNLASQGTTPFTVQQQNIDLSGGIQQLRAAAKGMKFKPIKPIKFKQKYYDPFKATLGEDWNEVYDPEGVQTAIPAVLSAAQKQGIAPIPTKRGGIVYMGTDGKLQDKPRSGSLFAKNGVKFAKRTIIKMQQGAVIQPVPEYVLGERGALQYVENNYPFLKPYLSNVRVYNGNGDKVFNKYADQVGGNIEFIGNNDFYNRFPEASGIPINDSNGNDLVYESIYPDNITIAHRGMEGDELNNAVAMDLISHYGRIDPTYKQLYDNALNLVMQNYSVPQMNAAQNLANYLKNTEEYKNHFDGLNEKYFADYVLDLAQEDPKVKDLLQRFYNQYLDGVVRDLVSPYREAYHEKPIDALIEAAKTKEQRNALIQLTDYINGIQRPVMEIQYPIFKSGGKTEYRGIKETSTGQTIGIPINLTNAQKGGQEPIKTNSGRQVIMMQDGTVIYVEAARQMRPFLKNGGQMNVIPEGALHARKNHLTDVDDMYKEVTHKGIPVISIEDGDIIQHAEVEHSEIIFTKKVTDKIEKYRKQGTEEAAIECGKLLVQEILYNTDDRTGLIQTIE